MNICQKQKSPYSKQQKCNMRKSATGEAQRLQKIPESVNEQCSYSNSKEQKNIHDYRKSIQKNEEVRQLLKEKNQLRNMYDQVMEINRHYEGQIQYYRNEMERIIKCNDEDRKDECRYHTKQQIEAQLKIKYLENYVVELQKNIGQLTNHIETLTKVNHTKNIQSKKINENHNRIVEKCRKVSKMNTSIKKSSEEVQFKYKRLQQKYDILCQELEKFHKNKNQGKDKATEKFQEYQSEIVKIKRKLQGQKQYFDSLSESWKEKESIYQNKISILERQLQKKTDDIHKIKQTLSEREDELKYTKKIFQQKTNGFREQQNLIKDLKLGDKQQQEKLMQKKMDENSPKKEDGRSELQKLELENKNLIKKIQQLQKENQTEVENYILTVGASEAMKKIIDDKNRQISRLMREKGALMTHKVKY